MKGRWTLGILIICALLVTNVGHLAAKEDWTRKADMPIGKAGHTAVTIKGDIYIFGGSDDLGQPLVTVEAYDTGAAFLSVDPTGKLVEAWGAIKKGSH